MRAAEGSRRDRAADRVARLRAIARGMGFAVTLLGGFVVFGWAAGLRGVVAPLLGHATMKTNTGIAFLLAGASVWLRKPGAESRRLPQLLASLVAVLALLTLSQDLFGWNPGIDQALLKDTLSDVASRPGRMAPMTALCFLVFGAATLAIGRRRGAWLGQGLALLLALVAGVAVIGYLYDVNALYGIAPYSTMALHTAAAFVLLALALLFSNPGAGAMAAITSDTFGGAMARRLLPAAVVSPVLLGWFRLEGQRRGLYGTEFGLSLMVISTICVLAVLIWWSAGSLLRLETGRHEAEEALRHSEERFRALVENSADGISLSTAEGVVIYSSPSLSRVLGYAADEVVGKQGSSFLHPDDVALLRDLNAQCIGNPGVPLQGVFRCRHKDGSWRDIESVRVNRLDDPSIHAVVSNFKDVTERRRSQEIEERSRRAQEASRLKSEFLANMSHELRTPLNAIIGFAELMHDGKVGAVSQGHKECLGDILTSSRHLLQLINDILDLAKVEAGKMDFRPEPVELAKLVGEMRDLLRSLSAQRRVTVSVEVEPGLGTVVLDPGKLKQVLYNFLSNALKFTPQEGHVTIRARAEGAEELRLEVEDTGVGIQPEDLPRLFTEFQQLDASASKAHQGTGLGLALTKRIVEAQGGRVGVSSVLGQGSTFYAVLPRSMPGPVQERLLAPDPRPPLAVGPSVLVVEDDNQERAWLVQTLSAAGYAVEVAPTGRLALERSQAHAYDAITLDLLLPDMAGWEVLRRIRAAGPNRETPVVVVTVVGEKNGAMGFAIHDYLVKPVRAEELLESLQRAGVPPTEKRPILVVEDDAQARRLMETTLKGIGYVSLVAASAEEGLRVAAETPPAAVVLDLLMPGMDGFEFLTDFRLTAAGRETPVIVWTAKDLTPDEQRRLATSAQAVVLKSEAGTRSLIEELQRYASGRRFVPIAPSRTDVKA